MKVKISEQRNSKTGKLETVISEINHNPEVIEKLARKLKRSCGAGGHVDKKSIIIQGSHSQKVTSILKKEGFEL
ncbi:MAG: translation initiation factor [Balneolaceae bacterium]|nr:MAG: translation initiation factor [Balneolaceae bacterium]